MSSRSSSTGSTASSAATLRISPRKPPLPAPPSRNGHVSSDRERVTPSLLLNLLTDYFESRWEALRFLRTFSPAILHIPPMATIERLATEAQIVRRIGSDPSTASVQQTAQFYSLPVRAVSKTYKTVTGENVTSLRQAIVAGRVSRVTGRAMMPRTVRDVEGQLFLFCTVIRATLPCRRQ